MLSQKLIFNTSNGSEFTQPNISIIFKEFFNVEFLPMGNFTTQNALFLSKILFPIYIIKAGVCLSVCLSTLKCSLDGQGYLQLPYDLIEAEKLFFQFLTARSSKRSQEQLCRQEKKSFLKKCILCILSSFWTSLDMLVESYQIAS